MAEYWYVFIVVAFVVIFFGVRIGKGLSKTLASRRAAVDPLSSVELKIGQKLELEGKLDKAVIAYSQMIEKYPDCEMAYLFMGYLQRKRRDYDAAAKAFEGALKVNPGSVDAMCELGSAMLNSGKRKEAGEMFGHVLGLEPQNVEANAFLGAMHHDSGEIEQAREHLQKAMAAATGMRLTGKMASIVGDVKRRLDQIKDHG
ncbi:MAG: tetratricopeptide repeat protein [Myxococcota bacterium]|jgi:tetratricopeptide (TPR) repeat protein